MEFGNSHVFRVGKRRFHLTPWAVESISAHLAQQNGRRAFGLLFGTSGNNCEIGLVRHSTATESADPLEEFTRFCRLFDASSSDNWSGPLQRVGWYVSRPEASPELTSAELQLHASLFTNRDLALICDLPKGGEIRFTASAEQPGESRFNWSRWRRPATAAALFAMVWIAAVLAFQKARVITQTPRTTPQKPAPAHCAGDDAAAMQQDILKLNQELSFQIARNRRLEAALELLRQRESHELSNSPVSLKNGETR